MRVLVTGANGHLGYHLVTALLEAGHQVRAGVRNVRDSTKTARLLALGDVEVVDAELGRAHQLRDAMDGVELLFHAAAVYSLVERHRTTEILEASIRGAEAVLRAAADARVRKVVLTSSTSTLPMVSRGEPRVDETRWTEDLRIPYVRAKVEGERMAWRTARELGLNLVTVLPSGLSGPGFARNTPSLDLIEAMMLGAFRFGVPRVNWAMVDVRDAARAHILAATKDCEGRFVVTNDTTPTLREMIETMHAIDERVSLPLMTIPDFLVPTLPLFDRFNHLLLGSPITASSEVVATFKGKVWDVSNRRIKEVLGWRQAITQEESLRDTMTTIRALRNVPLTEPPPQGTFLPSR